MASMHLSCRLLLSLQTAKAKGVGQKLIKFGIQCLKEEGVKLVFTYGDPIFYSKVGFRAITQKIAKAPLQCTQPAGWLCQSLVGDKIEPITEVRIALKHSTSLSIGKKGFAVIRTQNKVKSTDDKKRRR